MAAGFCFLTLAIASGLYYLSELVEEHTKLARLLLSKLINAVISIQVLLWLVDGLPLRLTVLSIISHVIYAINLRHFPIIKLSDPIFIISCLLVGFNHWAWFRYFSNPDFSSTLYTGGRSGGDYDYYATGPALPSFAEIASYFGLCIWLVPFALFVSLSAGENVLPSMGSEYATGSNPSATSSSSTAAGRLGTGLEGRKNRSKGMAKQLVDGVREWIGETGEVMGLWGGQKTRTF
ncbi:erv26 super protein [Myotisia sp. PD_48]|nr:erv26 super protein [Myotisia sp. PD_48]